MSDDGRAFGGRNGTGGSSIRAVADAAACAAGRRCRRTRGSTPPNGTPRALRARPPPAAARTAGGRPCGRGGAPGSAPRRPCPARRPRSRGASTAAADRRRRTPTARAASGGSARREAARALPRAARAGRRCAAVGQDASSSTAWPDRCRWRTADRRAADERQRLEADVADQEVLQHRLRQRLQLPRLVRERVLPQELELRPSARLLGRARRRRSIGALRVEAGGGHLAAARARQQRDEWRPTRTPTSPKHRTSDRSLPVPPPTSCRPPVVDAERVERAVVRADVDAAVGERQAGEVVERGDLVAARPQLLAGAARRGRAARRASSASPGSRPSCR